LFPQAVTHKV